MVRAAVRRARRCDPSLALQAQILVFGADNLPVRSDEWFMANEVVQIFLTFCANVPFPSYVGWRSAPVL